VYGSDDCLRPILFAAPNSSGLCQFQKRHLLTKGNHVVITKNVPVNKLAKRLECDSRMYLSIISKFG
jgi:hypothetical protein